MRISLDGVKIFGKMAYCIYHNMLSEANIKKCYTKKHFFTRDQRP